MFDLMKIMRNQIKHKCKKNNNNTNEYALLNKYSTFESDWKTPIDLYSTATFPWNTIPEFRGAVRKLFATG